MDHKDLDARLAGAYREEYFSDGDGDRVWNAAKKRAPHKRTPLRWAVPLAAVLAVALTVAAVPQARAAVGYIFSRALSIFDYLRMPASARPENTAVDSLIQSNVSTGSPVQTAQPEESWIKDIKFTIDSVLYDGQYVYISYTVDGSAVKDFGLKEPTEGHDVSYKFFSPEDNLHLDNRGLLQPAFDSGFLPKCEGGVWHAVNKFDATGEPLSGMVSGHFSIIFYSTTRTTQDDYPSADLGSMQQNFTFDADIGKKSCRSIDLSGGKIPLSGDVIITNQIWTDTISFENRKVSLEGSYLVVEGLTVRPTGIDFKILFIPSKELSWLSPQTLFGSLDAKLLSLGKEVGQVTGVEPYGANGAAIDCSVPMEFAKVQKLTVCVYIRHFSSIKNIPLELDKPVVVTIANGENFESTEQEGADPIPGGTFDIDLTQR